MADTASLLAAARASRLVVFAGAGISVAPPTSLPSWREFNGAVVRSLAAAAAPALTERLASQAADIVLARHRDKKLPPEYQAQVLAEGLGRAYFEVLRNLDSDRPNATHLALAWLARLGCVRAIVTTNFDRALEAAFAAVGAPLSRCYQPEHFRALAADLEQLGARDGPCHLLKLHGSVDDAATLIDTLAQRKRGLSQPTMDCVLHLLRSAHWLFLGYSGLDLEAEANYLALRQEAERAVGFTWFVRERTEPLEVVIALKRLYGERGGFVSGELPDWLLDLLPSISTEARDWIARRTRSVAAPDAREQARELEASVSAWARGLTAPMSSLALTFVVMACAQPQAAAELAQELLSSLDARKVVGADVPALRSVVANTLGTVLAGLGRHGDALRWLEIAADAARRAGDADTADRARANMAQSLETLGRVKEARAAYDAALAGFRSRDDPAAVSVAFSALAAHLIRQIRFDEALPLADEGVRWAVEAGDERARGTALSLVGMIAKLKGEHARALEVLAGVEALFTRLGNDEAAASVSCNRAEVLASLGQHDEAERIHLEALRVHERLDRLDNRGAVFLSLGALELQRGELDAADRWYAQAEEQFHAIGDPSNQALAALRRGGIELDLGRPRDASERAHAARPLVEGRNPALVSDLFDLIGKASLQMWRAPEAEQAYRHVCEFAMESENNRVLAAATTNLALALMLQQRDGEAAEAFARAAAMWTELRDEERRAYCELGEAAVRLDQRVAELSNAGHAARDPDQMRACAKEMLALYPDLIAKYEELGAIPLVAAFCTSAASTAKFTGALDQAGRWYQRAVAPLRAIEQVDRARWALEQCEQMLKPWTDALLQNREFARALPELLLLIDVAEELGHRGVCASAAINGAILLLHVSRDAAGAKRLAERALALPPDDASEVARARAVLSQCDGALAGP